MAGAWMGIWDMGAGLSATRKRRLVLAATFLIVAGLAVPAWAGDPMFGNLGGTSGSRAAAARPRATRRAALRFKPARLDLGEVTPDGTAPGVLLELRAEPDVTLSALAVSTDSPLVRARIDPRRDVGAGRRRDRPRGISTYGSRPDRVFASLVRSGGDGSVPEVLFPPEGEFCETPG